MILPLLIEFLADGKNLVTQARVSVDLPSDLFAPIHHGGVVAPA